MTTTLLAITIGMTVGDLVRDHPELTRLLDALDIDYCCGGKRTIEEVCAEKGLDPKPFVTVLEAVAQSGGPSDRFDGRFGSGARRFGGNKSYGHGGPRRHD